MTHRNARRGFTLIELLVSLGIFAVVVLAATSAYLAFIGYNRQSQTASTIVNSVAFSVDGMARDIRSGQNYVCIGGCSSGGVARVTFIDANDCGITYAYDAPDQTITRAVDASSAYPDCEGETSQSAAPITDAAVVINTLRFYVRGATTSADPQDQPMMTIAVGGYACVPNTDCTGTGKIPFSIQTAATQRLPDL